jgi:hypothetical protein
MSATDFLQLNKLTNEEINKIPLLTPEQELELFEKLKENRTKKKFLIK